MKEFEAAEAAQKAEDDEADQAEADAAEAGVSIHHLSWPTTPAAVLQQ